MFQNNSVVTLQANQEQFDSGIASKQQMKHEQLEQTEMPKFSVPAHKDGNMKGINVLISFDWLLFMS